MDISFGESDFSSSHYSMKGVQIQNIGKEDYALPQCELIPYSMKQSYTKMKN
jgi:hypothetical protein